MQAIGIRKFTRSSFYSLIKDLPLFITVDGKPKIAVINELSIINCQYKEGCQELDCKLYNILHKPSQVTKAIWLCQRHQNWYSNNDNFEVNL